MGYIYTHKEMMRIFKIFYILIKLCDTLCSIFCTCLLLNIILLRYTHNDTVTVLYIPAAIILPILKTKNLPLTLLATYCPLLCSLHHFFLKNSLKVLSVLIVSKFSVKLSQPLPVKAPRKPLH